MSSVLGDRYVNTHNHFTEKDFNKKIEIEEEEFDLILEDFERFKDKANYDFDWYFRESYTLRCKINRALGCLLKNQLYLAQFALSVRRFCSVHLLIY
jgi:hypothetical protein